MKYSKILKEQSKFRIIYGTNIPFSKRWLGLSWYIYINKYYNKMTFETYINTYYDISQYF